MNEENVLPPLRIHDDGTIQVRFQMIKNGWLVRGVKGEPVFYPNIGKALMAVSVAVTQMAKSMEEENESP